MKQDETGGGGGIGGGGGGVGATSQVNIRISMPITEESIEA